MFAPEVTLGEVLCHLYTVSAVIVCVFEEVGWRLTEEEITHMLLTRRGVFKCLHFFKDLSFFQASGSVLVCVCVCLNL